MRRLLAARDGHDSEAASRRGQALVEYAMILALMALVVTLALSFLQSGLTSAFSDIGACLELALDDGGGDDDGDGGSNGCLDGGGDDDDDDDD